MRVLHSNAVTVGYGKKRIVNQVNIEAMKGEIVCLLGPNGAGKTTIIRTLAGLLAPLSGTVAVNEKNIDQLSQKELAKTLSVVLTKRTGCGLMTVFEVASMGRHPYTNHFGKLSNNDLKIVESALMEVNAIHLSDRYFEELSDGEKQKVLVARALVQEPEVIILDEPTTHLDIRHRIELMEILKGLSKKKGITVLLSLHEIDIALKCCDQVLLIKEGEILACGSPETVVNESLIHHLYDIKNANFNHLLGSIEISNQEVPKHFIIGGNGTGIPVYRLMAKLGIGVATGIIHENDVDYEIARTIGLSIESETAFDLISEDTIIRAKKVIDQVETVIDTGAPIGFLNKGNLQLITYALSVGKKIHSLRTPNEFENLMGKCHNAVAFYESATALSHIYGSKNMQGDLPFHRDEQIGGFRHDALSIEF